MRWIKRLALACWQPGLCRCLMRCQQRRIIPVDPLVKVFRGETKLSSVSPEADVAVGEHATIQIVFRSAKSVANLRATVSGDVPGAVVRLVGYVKVGKPYHGAPPDTLPSADRQFPDLLLEDQGIAVAGIRTSRSGSQCLRANPAFSREC